MTKERTLTRRQLLKTGLAVLAPSLPLANAVAEMRKSEQITDSIPQKLSSYTNVQSPAIDENRATLRNNLRNESEKHAKHAVVSSLITSAIVTGEVLFLAKQKQNVSEEEPSREPIPYPTKNPNAA